MKTISILGIVIAVLVVTPAVFVLGSPLSSSAESSALAVSCSASASSIGINQSVTFSVAVSGGTGSYSYSWSGACSGSGASCSNSFSSPGVQTVAVAVSSASQGQSSSASASCSVAVVGQINCSSNSQCGTNGFTGDLFCQGNNVYQNYKTYTCNNPGTSSSSCTNSTTAQLQTTCSVNQTCSNGSCVAVACSTNAQCGINGLTGDLFCQSDGNVYKKFRTWTCNNPGSANSSCSHSDTDQKQVTCTANQTCSGGSCVNQNIGCTSNADCGTNTLSASPFCTGNSVYQNYITPTCLNPGTVQSSCINPIIPQLVNNCTANQTCSGGSCVNQNIGCTSNADCGANGLTSATFCQGSNVYQNYRTYTCNNAGTVSSSCTNSTVAQLQTTCFGNQTCSNGSCANSCTSNYQQRCSGNNLYWYDSCDNQQGLIQYCPNGCYNNSCSSNNYNNNYITVQTNSATNAYSNQATLNGYLSSNNNYSCNNYVWFQYGTAYSYGYETTHQLQNYSGAFSQIVNISSGIAYHFRAVAQNCSGNTVYGQDMTTFGSGTVGDLAVNKTVKNLTSGSGFASSIYANPSDMLMFKITIQANGNQNIQNVLVRDMLPANLVYNNQLVVASVGNSNYNYSGSITSGINLNTIYAGQTVTITYQAQVASVQNFSYGTTTLNNSVSVTSSNSGYNPVSNASVIVTRAAVLAATTISTGLTNNFWVDSFFLPLIITLILIWMWRAGMFFGIEKWLDNKKKARRGYNAQKELSTKISRIQKLEKV